MRRKKFINQEQNDSDIYNFEKGITSKDTEEEHNEYSNHIYVSESPNKERLYDRNNPLVRIILWLLGLFAAIGSIYYILTGLGII